ncbi:hypothetical protein MJL33_31890, partial [Salmonella enterica subsp. enterica serovar Kentucky]|nr:hypothetical protein [Salmonella enterica subsp. enterica serovar Kentucky]
WTLRLFRLIKAPGDNLQALPNLRGLNSEWNEDAQDVVVRTAGLEADIAMKGSVDLVRRRLDMEAVVAPEISATVGVAAAFAVNP